MSKTFCDRFPEECINLDNRDTLEYIPFGRSVPKRRTKPLQEGIPRDPSKDNEEERRVKPKPEDTFGKAQERPVFKKGHEKRRPVAPKGGLTKPVRETHTELTSDERMKAKILEASKIAELESKTQNRIFLSQEERANRLQTGIKKAQRYLDREGINYTIDPELSTTEGIVLINNETGVPKVAFRGTNFTNVSDLKTDLAIVMGQEEATPAFRGGKSMVEATTELYGVPDEIIGFSKGGAMAITIGTELEIPTTTFNPAVGPQALKNVPVGSDNTIIRVTEDPVSALAGVKPGAFKIKSLLPLQEPKYLNPESGMAVHDLTNFSQTGIRRSNNTEVVAEEVMRLGQRHAELIAIDSAKTAVDNGQTLTEWLKDFSPPDVNEDGTFSNRIYDEAKLFQSWEKAGGDITIPEVDSIIENSERAMETGVTTDDFVIKDYEIEELVSKPQAQREVVVQAEAQELMNYHEQLQERMSPAYATRDAIKASVSPSNIGIGLVGGAIGAKGADVIDPNLKAGMDAHQALSGGLGGIATEGIISTLGGGGALTGTALAPAFLGGGAGAVAGYETNKAVANSLEKAGANRETIESISDIAGGTSAGLAGSAVGIGTATLLGAELGELGGPAGVVLGAGVGALFGLGQYAVGAVGRNTPKARQKRADAKYEQERLEQIAEEAGFESLEAFNEVYADPEEYYKQVRIEDFGYDFMNPEPKTQEQVQEEVDTERERQLENAVMNQYDPYFAYQQRRRGETQGFLGPQFEFSQAEIQEAREEQLQPEPEPFYGPVQPNP